MPVCADNQRPHERKPFRLKPNRIWRTEIVSKRTMIIAISDSMNTGVNSERIYVGNQAFTEGSAQTGLLGFVESRPVDKVIFGLVKNLNCHEVRLRIRSFADSQSENFASPVSIWRWRSLSNSFCQSAIGICLSLRQRSSQSISTALSFSSIVI